MPLTSGPIDPYYRLRRLEDLGRTGEYIRARIEAKKAKEEKEAMEKRLAAEKRFEILARTSPAAAIQFGKDQIDKLGPEGMEYMQYAISDLEQKRAESSRIEDSFFGAVGEKEGQQQQMGDFGKMLQGFDTPTVPGMPQNAMVGQAAQNKAGQMNPLVEAYRAMPFEERMQAQKWMEAQGFPVPPGLEEQIFDPSKLPSAVRAVYEAQRGNLTGPSAKAAGVEAGLEPSAAVTTQAETAAEGRKLRARDQDLTASQQAISRREVALKEKKEERIAKAQEATGEDGSLPDKERKEFLDGLESDILEDSKLKAKRSGLEDEEGAKARLSKYQARQLKNALGEKMKEGLSPIEAEFVSNAALDMYQSLLSEGKSPKEAWAAVMERL